MSSRCPASFWSTRTRSSSSGRLRSRGGAPGYLGSIDVPFDADPLAARAALLRGWRRRLRDRRVRGQRIEVGLVADPRPRPRRTGVLAPLLVRAHGRRPAALALRDDDVAQALALLP